MHSYLFVGLNKEKIEIEIGKLVKKLGVKPLEFELTKIGQVRELHSFTKLKVNKPTAILIRDVNNATTEALNAFLKNLEEPQENIKYILTASSEHRVLPTIVSRCQIVKTKGLKLKAKGNKNAEEFIKASVGEKLKIVDKIRKREEAVLFVQNLIITWHDLLTNKDCSLSTAKALKRANQTLVALKGNGNVALQLANFAVNL